MGQRLAKLQMKLLLAMLLLNFDLTLIDKAGQLLEETPRPNWNDHLACKPPPDSCFVRLDQQKSSFGHHI